MNNRKYNIFLINTSDWLLVLAGLRQFSLHSHRGSYFHFIIITHF